ncbi:putative ribosomal protein L7 [Rosa chinensis]|uniref:Putative ribosomal protein L7 n=1 Tax=Rosa chinensis TaxID=74649 RepID=A0A2P6RVK1_ROSCH|nr:60S ribosomal protein L7-1 [Rosa chinensis]XP_040371031.1 60S ribosomal protein L7-1 [Rosa chinensis]PRQ50448.1 putative ribosomal protein L7 [Rosa chinensis]
MSEEVAQPLATVPEIILKKRKSNEELALRRKEQLEQRKFRLNKNKQEFIKKPEDFVKEFRYREVDLVQMKHRLKRKRPALETTNPQLLLVIRIQGKNDMHPAVRKNLYSLNLRKIFNAVFVRADEAMLEKLQRVEPYVTYGYPSLKNVKELIYKKGYAKIGKQRVPLTDNNLIEEALGKSNIICIEDIVHEIASTGKYFKEAASFLWPFTLNKPEVGLKGVKARYLDGGDSGNREDKINDLISKMN